MLSAKIRQHQSKQPLSEKVGRVRRTRFCTQDTDVGGKSTPWSTCWPITISQAPAWGLRREDTREPQSARNSLRSMTCATEDRGQEGKPFSNWVTWVCHFKSL